MIKDHPHIGIAYNAYEPVAGRTHERISEESVEKAAEDVFAAVTKLGYDVVLIPLKRSIENFIRRIKNARIDVIVNLCEGFRGVPKLEFNITGLFELLHIPFTGNLAKTLSICQDKFRTKAILEKFGIPTAKAELVRTQQSLSNFKYPVIVKPNSEDASLGIYADSIVYNNKDLTQKIDQVIATYQQPAIVENFIEGREFNVAVKGNDYPVALPVSEIDFTMMPADQPHICGYEAKWYEDHELFRTSVPVCPAHIDDDIAEELQGLAVKAFKAMECRGYARVDFRMNSRGQIFVLEVNPNPDISRNAGYARALTAAKIDYTTFWNELLEYTLDRKDA